MQDIATKLSTAGWVLTGPTKTSGGWKGTIQRGTMTVLVTGDDAREVLESLQRAAAAYDARKSEAAGAANDAGGR